MITACEQSLPSQISRAITHSRSLAVQMETLVIARQHGSAPSARGSLTRCGGAGCWSRMILRGRCFLTCLTRDPGRNPVVAAFVVVPDLRPYTAVDPRSGCT